MWLDTFNISQCVCISKYSYVYISFKGPCRQLRTRAPKKIEPALSARRGAHLRARRGTNIPKRREHFNRPAQSRKHDRYTVVAHEHLTEEESCRWSRSDFQLSLRRRLGVGGKVHSCASKEESSALGRYRRRAGPAGQGFPPDPYLNHQHPGRAGDGDGDRGRAAARRTRRSEPERRGSGRTVRSRTKAWRREALQPPPVGALPPQRPRRRTTAPATAACRLDAVPSPDGAFAPKPAASHARHGTAISPPPPS